MNNMIAKEAAEAIRDLAAEVDLLKMASERSARLDHLMAKLVDNGTVKTAEEYIGMRSQLGESNNEDVVEKALELFPDGLNVSSFGKVASERDISGLSAEERFIAFLDS